MYYDPVRNSLVDMETGDMIPVSDDDHLPDDIKAQIQLKKDHDYALALSQEPGQSVNFQKSNRLVESLGSRNSHYGYVQQDAEMKMQQELIDMNLDNPNAPLPEATGEHGWFDDLTLARALQAMEFEMNGETYESRLRREDFNGKEYRASSCKRQLLTVSTFICLVQIGLLVAMIQDDGYAPHDENPLYGPPALTMVRYGAKDAALIVYRNEWWRLITPIFLHAGIMHLLSNAIIQLRVGGYLNLAFGSPNWLFIYFSSGIYGNMLSCIFLPDSIGVGSSGAVLGILSAWFVWIVFRWKKIPDNAKGQRNCQLVMVTAAITITLVFSFSKYVDWAAHFGGAIQGAISGVMMLTVELDNIYSKWGLRALAACAFIGSFVWAFVVMITQLKPSKEYLDQYDANDDWG